MTRRVTHGLYYLTCIFLGIHLLLPTRIDVCTCLEVDLQPHSCDQDLREPLKFSTLTNTNGLSIL